MRGLSILLFCFSGSILAFTNSAVENLIETNLPNANIGIVLMDADSGEVLYERRSQEPLTPASTTKLFTSAAALIELGENYQFLTDIKIQLNQLNNGVLNGDLVVVFSGDPSLTTENVEQLIAKVKHFGIQSIRGNVLIDDTQYQGSFYGPGWSSESLAWYYSAPVSSVILDENKIAVQLTSNKTLGKKATLSLEGKNTKELKIVADVVSVSEEAAKLCQINVELDVNNNPSIQGCWPARKELSTLQVAMKYPHARLKTVLRNAFKKKGIDFKGDFKITKSKGSLSTIAVNSSKPLRHFLKKILQESNNLYTEALTKTLGAKLFSNGTFQMGTLAIQQILAEPTGINFKTMRLVDGSGLSRYNSIAPQHFAQLLYSMHHAKQHAIFKNTLPLASNKQSTLAVRLDQTQLPIRAKTGWMSGVSSLAGYLQDYNNRSLIFVIMVDNSVHDRAALKSFENTLCLWFQRDRLEY